METLLFDTETADLPELLEQLATLHGDALIAMSVLPSSAGGYHVVLTITKHKKK